MSQFICGIEKTFEALKRYFNITLDFKNSCIEIEQIKIKIVLLCSPKNCIDNNSSSTNNLQFLLWNKFEDLLLQNNSDNLINGCDAILFYTTERLPRGDYTGSLYNTSRMIREFFENTTYAKTANYENIIDKIKELLLEIKLKENK